MWREHINTSIYKWGPIARVQRSKAGSSQMVTGAKNDFLLVPVLEPSLYGLEDALEMVLRTLLAVLGSLWELLRTPKNIDSVQYILQKSSFPGYSVTRHFSMLPLKCSGAAGSVFGGLLEGFWMAVWAL